MLFTLLHPDIVTVPKGVGRKNSRGGGATEKTRPKIAPLSLPLLYQCHVYKSRESTAPLLPTTDAHDCTRWYLLHLLEKWCQSENISAASDLGPVYTRRTLTGVKLNNNRTQYFSSEIFWQCNQGTKPELH